jgi:hypothetical protein
MKSHKHGAEECDKDVGTAVEYCTKIMSFVMPSAPSMERTPYIIDEYRSYVCLGEAVLRQFVK